ncbi:MAG: DUF4149 domain-containing protein [Herminiimonas sp.]|nr:DUF4149 domain-containing protein [Herminiimonas sp.]
MLQQRARLLIATFWVGSLWSIGYLVAPTLFATLADRALAGTIAGSLFRIEAWVSVVCAVLLLAMLWRAEPQASGNRLTLLKLVLGMLACTLIGYFGLQPFMASIREASAAAGGMSAEARTQFGALHGAASGIFLLQSLLGVVLILKLR